MLGILQASTLVWRCRMLCVSLRAPGSEETGLMLFALDQGLIKFRGHSLSCAWLTSHLCDVLSLDTHTHTPAHTHTHTPTHTHTCRHPRRDVEGLVTASHLPAHVNLSVTCTDMSAHSKSDMQLTCLQTPTVTCN